MLIEIFYWFLNMNLIASLVGLIILLIRSIKVIPRRFAVFLWLPPFLRMVLPVSIGNPLSLVGILSPYAIKTLAFMSGGPVPLYYSNGIVLADSYDTFRITNQVVSNIFYVCGTVWLVVSVILVLLFTLMYLWNLNSFRKAKHLFDNVYESKNVSVPVVIGVFYPKIVLPVGYPKQKLKYALDHEKNHIRKADNLWRLIAIYTVLIHWFNPFCWLMLKYFLLDMEMACDERCIAHYTESERDDYMNILLSGLSSKSVFASSFGGSKIGRRLENIVGFRSITFCSSFCFVLFIVVTIFFLSMNGTV